MTGSPVDHGSKFAVSVDDYLTFQSQGFLIARSLVPEADIAELIDHTDELIRARSTEYESSGADSTTSLGQYIPIEFQHRSLPIHERFLLHSNVLDVVEALIGPDVLALQDMLFLKGPGAGGEGYHQDAFFVPTIPQTLIGAWLAIDHADEENGCLWMAKGSQIEPIYPDKEDKSVYPDKGGKTVTGENRTLSDIPRLAGLSVPDDSKNELMHVANRYAAEPAIMSPGDVAFFGGSFIHWSGPNRSTTRTRRSFVGHYCNARSIVPWDRREPVTGEMMNHLHILARGSTHLPFARPRFGTASAASAT